MAELISYRISEFTPPSHSPPSRGWAYQGYPANRVSGLQSISLHCL